MGPEPRWRVVLARPGEAEMGLLAELAGRRDARIVALVDPQGRSLGASFAEIMRVPVHASLADIPATAADYLIVSTADAENNDLAATAERRGWRVMRARDFRTLIRDRMPEARETVRGFKDLGFLERETEAIHRTLSRIEEALEQESLLRWLLSLATRSVRAASGSLMLYDERTEELYIAFAYGLSEATLHRTRVRLGEGIAGGVARSRRPRLLVGDREIKSRQRVDRPDIATAICMPLVWEDRLLGVLNLSSGRDDPPLGETELDTAAALSHRFGMILARFLRLQETYSGEMFRLADRHLRELAERGSDLGEILSAWASGLAVTVAADRVSLTLPCEDGSLLVAEGTPQEAVGHWHEAMENAAWCDVLASGAPLVVRQETPLAAGEAPVTIFYLPVGKQPVQAVLTLLFESGQAAHEFHTLSGELVYLLERRLKELIERARRDDHLERLSELSRRLALLMARIPDEPERAVEEILAAARGLTGARDAVVVRAVAAGEAVFGAGDSPRDPDWAVTAARLLEEAREDGWRVTVVSDSNAPKLAEASMLAVPASAQAAAPGLLLSGKSRRYPLDGSIFTAFDAELVQRLAALLPAVAEGRERTDAAPKAPDAAAIESLEPPASDSVAHPSGSPAFTATEAVGDTGGEPATGGRRAAARAVSAEMVFEVSDGRGLVRDAVRREMDRCDRYHTTFAVVTLRVARARSAGVAAWARDLSQTVRSSDRVFAPEEGTLIVLVPEDIQSITRIQRRLVEKLCDIAGLTGQDVHASHLVYPGQHDSADLLVADALAAGD